MTKNDAETIVDALKKEGFKASVDVSQLGYGVTVTSKNVNSWTSPYVKDMVMLMNFAANDDR